MTHVKAHRWHRVSKPTPFTVGRALLLASSRAVTRFQRDSLVFRFRKRLIKWGFITGKTG